jgi:hypothetical protein
MGIMLPTDRRAIPSKEGSFYAIREIWSPVFYEKRFITPEFNGEFTIENRYHYTNQKDCSFTCRLVSLPLPGQTDRKIDYESKIASPDIQPTCKGILRVDLPADFTKSDVLYIKAVDPADAKIYTWSWACQPPEKIAAENCSSTRKRTD